MGVTTGGDAIAEDLTVDFEQDANKITKAAKQFINEITFIYRIFLLISTLKNKGSCHLAATFKYYNFKN
jgi:hypothetical protein